jgi:nicotinamidase-related amidase
VAESDPKFVNGALPDWQQRWDEPLDWPIAQQEPTVEQPATLEGAALVLIDVDKKSFDRNIIQVTRASASRGRELASRTYDAVVPNLVRLVEHFRERKRPVIFVQWGWHRFQYPPLQPRYGEDVVIKNSRGAFSTSNLQDVLKRHDIKTCVLAGADTAICVTSTACGAFDNGYRIVLVDDATLSNSPDAHAAALRVLANMGARVMSCDQVIKL